MDHLSVAKISLALSSSPSSLSVLQLHPIFVYLNVFQTDLRTALILPVQPCPGPANLSPMPTHLFSITSQTNWSVTPLSGPRLHFSSHPSPPKHSFFFTATFLASQTPSLSSCAPSTLNCLCLSRLNRISPSLLHARARGHARAPMQEHKKIKYLPTQAKTLVLAHKLQTE